MEKVNGARERIAGWAWIAASCRRAPKDGATTAAGVLPIRKIDSPGRRLQFPLTPRHDGVRTEERAG
ncbi:hypothetical protein AKJ09_02609 [Labilithrix luteola]|uniref:Uncharacterized protein n=1 Tax=Labilithrix luteola TaxID=1391654 RepID=A0A0K1PQX7_9BACT|nr:hypothetical protein AKJ09_02609 [Labilithrix luteola]